VVNRDDAGPLARLLARQVVVYLASLGAAGCRADQQRSRRRHGRHRRHRDERA
jgi:hypothetical protein